MKKLISGATAIVSVTALTAVTLAQTTYSTTTSSSDDAAVLGMSWIVFCCVFCAAMLVPLVLSYLVYKDAQKNGVESPILWALITFVFGLLGILIYFLVGKNNKK